MSKIKKLFETPKKAVYTSICAAAIIAAIGTGSAFAAGALAQSSAIGAQNAQNFAFADAGIDPVSAKVEKTDFDFELGQFVYDVEFIANGTEYEYLIKASDGTVLKKDIEIKDKDEAKLNENAKIDNERAKDIAFKDADVKASKATFVKSEIDTDDGKTVYEIEFVSNGIEYEYEIDAETGAVLSKSQDSVSDKKPAQGNNGGTASGNSSVPSNNPSTPAKHNGQNNPAAAESAQISSDKAQSIALSNAGVAASEVKFAKCELEYDDGVQVYDIDFYTKDYKYEYEINAKTGAITDKSAEKISGGKATAAPPKSDASGTYIGVEKAKSIAVEKAGLSTADVSFKKAKLDREDGKVVYEIEFYKNRTEYECTIDALTGAIIEFAAEHDD